MLRDLGATKFRDSVIAPLVLALLLSALLLLVLAGAIQALDQSKVVQPAEPWQPAIDYSRKPSPLGLPLTLKLWPPQMSGLQPLRSLAVQFNNPYLVKGPLRMSWKFADGSSSEEVFSADEVRDNDYVAFPMDGRVPERGDLTSLGAGSIGVIEVTSPDGFVATCAIYELLDGTKLTVPGCS